MVLFVIIAFILGNFIAPVSPILFKKLSMILSGRPLWKKNFLRYRPTIHGTLYHPLLARMLLNVNGCIKSRERLIVLLIITKLGWWLKVSRRGMVLTKRKLLVMLLRQLRFALYWLLLYLGDGSFVS
jgi:hypothetical protein